MVSHTRLGVIACLLAVSCSTAWVGQRPDLTPRTLPLTAFPRRLNAWQGRDLPLDPKEIEIAGVHDYVNRSYSLGDAPPVELYIGYYPSQRTGDSIHSPKNCLPGAGWLPLRSRTVPLPGADAADRINEYIVQRDVDQALVLYWYQARGRTIASEYSAKFWMMSDAIARRRTDGALVRVWTPIVNGEGAAETEALGFTRAFRPYLASYVPD